MIFSNFTLQKKYMSVNKELKRITTNTLHKMKEAGEKISMLTAYDFSFAKIIDGAGIDVILVGDSASNAWICAGAFMMDVLRTDPKDGHSSVLRRTTPEQPSPAAG